MSVIDELVTLLGLKVDPKAKNDAADFTRIIDGVTAGAVAMGAALVTAATTFKAYAISQAYAIDEAGKFADATRISFERLQELEYAQKRAGGSVQELRTDLASLNKTLSHMQPGQFNAGMMMMGISSRDASGKLKTADEVLLSVADRMQGMSRQRQTLLAEKLGISPGTLKLLQKGRDGIKELTDRSRSLGIILDESAKEKAAKFKDATVEMTAVVDGLGKSIAIGLIPGLTESAEAITKFVLANRKWIASGIKQAVDGVGQGFEMVAKVVDWAYKGITKLIGPTASLNKELDATQAVAIAVAIAIGAIAVSTLAATWPILLLVAGIAAVILVLEDLYAAFNGQKSIIGDWVKSFTDAYPNIAAALGNILSFGLKVAAFFGGAFIDAVSAFGSKFMSITETLIGMWSKFFSLIETVGTFIGNVAGWAMTPMGPDGSNPIAAADRMLKPTAPGSVSNTPAGVVRGATGGGSGTVNNNVTINGAGDPRAVGQEVVQRTGMGQSLQMMQPGMTGPVTG